MTSGTRYLKLLIVFLFFSCFPQVYGWDEDILISTKNTSLLLSGNYGETLRFSHYGNKLTDGEIGALHDGWAGMNRNAYPAFGDETTSLTSLQVVHSDGNPTACLALEKIEKTPASQGELTSIHLKDKYYPLSVVLNYETKKDDDIIEMWVKVVNGSDGNIVVKRLDSGFLPVRTGDAWLTHLHGTWTAETQPTVEKLTRGCKVIRNLDGARNGQNDHAEFMLSLDGKPEEDRGQTIGVALAWSGNYEIRLDTENKYCHNIMAGIHPEMSELKLSPGETLTTPKMVVTFSKDGMGGVSRNFHNWARHGGVHGGQKERSILLNSWEGVYLDVEENKLDEMMRDFAQLGGELFVMDDGWFGDKYPRKKDNAGLGDWTVDKTKLPHGVEGLISKAKKHGLKFGIWIEPESVNTQSELYDEHPEWVLQVENRDLKKTRGGTQVLLDLSNPDVQEFVFGVVDNLMQNYPEIEYIKWDANTPVMNFGSTYLGKDNQLALNHSYHKGLENVLQRIREKYPELVIQACGGGGGRVNYGTMPYFDEVWVSDNTDALQRIYMQWGTSLFYPSMAMAQHVSASPNHQTGRATPIKFRFDVAMTGRLGMEMQPSAMIDSEKRFAKQAISEYKRIRPVIQFGDLYRLLSPYEGKGVSSLMYVTPEKDKAVFFSYKLEHFRDQAIPRFYMNGLDETRDYKIREINVAEGKNPSYLDGKTISGNLLMNVGIELPLEEEYASRVYELTAM